MKKNIFKIAAAVLVLAAVTVCIIACNKEKIVKENHSVSNSINESFTKDSYNWIHSELTNATLNYLESLKENESLNYDELCTILLNVLNQNGLKYPLNTSSVSNNVLIYAEQIHDIDFITIPYDSYITENRKIMSKISCDEKLSYDEKMCLAVLLECQLACKDFFMVITDSESKGQQLPRTCYSSRNGDTRYERQMSACMDYKWDGHTETITAFLDWIRALPFSPLVDLAACKEEISRNYWDHVH